MSDIALLMPFPEVCMHLHDLLLFGSVTVQCHNVPDADAIASAYALHQYFARAGKTSKLVFGGSQPLEKPSLRQMVEHLCIPIEHLPSPDAHIPDLLVLADCQHGAGNVMPIPAWHVAVIDHHVPEGVQPELSLIRPDCGACASLVRDILLRERFSPDRAVNTALHYGLYMDTQCFAELRNSLDRDLLQEENIDAGFVENLKANNLRWEDLLLASETLSRLEYLPEHRAAIGRAPLCDPNLLGFLADMILQVEGVDVCLVWHHDGALFRYSVRSVTRDVKASDLAAWLGGGGGHLRKAGGRLPCAVLKERHPSGDADSYFKNRLRSYFAQYPIIDCAALTESPLQGASLYRKLPITVGYVPCAGLFPEASTIFVRMLESDAAIEATPDTHLMIGIIGEVYPIKAANFEKSYTPLNQSFVPEFEYAPSASEGRKKGVEPAPSVLNLDKGRSIRLLDHARACKSKESKVFARQLTQGVKVFTTWDRDQYHLGNAGDWLACREDDPFDVYVVRGDIFAKTYAPA